MSRRCSIMRNVLDNEVLVEGRGFECNNRELEEFARERSSGLRGCG